MDALLLGLKGRIAGGDIEHGSRGYITGSSWGIIKEIFREVKNLVSQITRVVELLSPMKGC